MTQTTKIIFAFIGFLLFPVKLSAIYTENYVETKIQKDFFPLATETGIAPLYVSDADYPGVLIAIHNLQKDLQAVTDKQPEIVSNKFPASIQPVIIGTIGKNPLIDQLIQAKKLDASLLEGKKETFVIQTIDKPFKGVASALVIAGSDKRGTIFGIYDLSAKIGVSPWYYWADVPVKKSKTLSIQPGSYSDGEPAVEYRGIFINDEAPALSGWVEENFGTFNHQFYEKVFELILRMKGNFLWPAMWGRAFYDDDPENGALADTYGIVIGTSHHEPMGRAHDEWRRYGQGAWNYDTNPEALQQFWKSGMQRIKNQETVVTLAMRGDGDEPMSEKSNIALLEKIVSDQRDIIQSVTGKSPEQTPQVWALYKEVQDYYDRGMRVPDDVTLLLCDDNWGNVRKLPDLNAPDRKGGYGMYYHYDYVGGPRNYKWLNTNPIPRIWEQMSLSYDYGVKKLWIVNVGDIKPMEYPIEFFLDLAWNPHKWTPENLQEHTRLWAEQQFGPEYATPIADFLSRYAKYNARRKPELLAPNTYSLTNYGEADRIVSEYNSLAKEAEAVYDKLSPEQKEAYYQLVLFPILACANLNEMYVTAGKNRMYAEQGNPEANRMAEKVKQLYEKDSLLTNYYHKEMSGGKWNHFMDQTHIGYTYWQQPEKNAMPEVFLIHEAYLIDILFPFPKSEETGFISIEAEHFTAAVNGKDFTWKVIPDLGRTLSAVTVFPTTIAAQTPGPGSPRLEYSISVEEPKEIEVTVYLSPTLNFNNNKGLRYAVGVNDETPQIINFNGTYTQRDWERWVADNSIKVTTKHRITSPGKQTLHYYVVDPAVVLQKIVINTGGLKDSYLGPEENETAP
jgi:hypothetical protein